MREVLLIILAFLAFAFLHSVCVTETVKGLAVRIFGTKLVQALYRFIFTIFSIVTTLAAILFIFSLPDVTVFSIDAPWVWIMRILQLFGLAFLLSAFRIINIMEFTGIRQALLYLRGRELVGDVEGIRQGRIQKTGAYGIVRHPMYTGAIMIFLFSPQYSRSWIVVRIISIAYFVLGTLIEEKRLKGKFGREYIDYMKDVPMLIPRIRRAG